jgi:D-tyrosyl-tRNA(Tyr) deacylase
MANYVTMFRITATIRRRALPNVQTGIFGAMMAVELLNDGPVTLILDK